MNSPICVSLHSCALMFSSSQMYSFFTVANELDDARLTSSRAGNHLTTTASTIGYLPTYSSSFHSKMMMLTMGSSFPSAACFSKSTEMDGSNDPPHDFMLYMPEHICLSSSLFCCCRLVSRRGSCSWARGTYQPSHIGRDAPGTDQQCRERP